MKIRSRQGLRRFQVEVWSYGNYVERIVDLERALAKKPRVLRIEIVGTGEIPADVALRFRSVLMERSPKTRIVTNARSSLQGVPVLRQFGLIENEKVDHFLAAAFSKSSEPAKGSLNAMNEKRAQRREKARARQMRR